MLIRELRLRDYPYKSRKGLSERFVKSFLRKKGYEVFRGTTILGPVYSVNYHLYDNVRKKYERLEEILCERLGEALPSFRSSLPSGIPDFFAYCKKESFFVEVKLEHEHIKKHQLECMSYLEKHRFKVVVFRIKKNVYREATEVDIENNKRVVKVRQKRFRN